MSRPTITVAEIRDERPELEAFDLLGLALDDAWRWNA